MNIKSGFGRRGRNNGTLTAAETANRMQLRRVLPTELSVATSSVEAFRVGAWAKPLNDNDGDDDDDDDGDDDGDDDDGDDDDDDDDDDGDDDDGDDDDVGDDDDDDDDVCVWGLWLAMFWLCMAMFDHWLTID